MVIKLAWALENNEFIRDEMRSSNGGALFDFVTGDVREAELTVKGGYSFPSIALDAVFSDCVWFGGYSDPKSLSLP